MQSQYDELMLDPEFRKEFAVEKFILACTEAISVAMDRQEVSKAELARRLGKSRSWVTQLLSGGRNVTARTLAEVAYALDLELVLDAKPAHPEKKRVKLPRKTSSVRDALLTDRDVPVPAHS
jgi:transcriptional regulator with XRE-family HTH domain